MILWGMKLAVHYLKDYIYNLLKLVLIVKEFYCIQIYQIKYIQIKYYNQHMKLCNETLYGQTTLLYFLIQTLFVDVTLWQSRYETHH